MLFSIIVAILVSGLVLKFTGKWGVVAYGVTIMTFQLLGYLPKWFLMYMMAIIIMYIYATTTQFDTALLKILTLISIVFLISLSSLKEGFKSIGEGYISTGKKDIGSNLKAKDCEDKCKKETPCKYMMIPKVLAENADKLGECYISSGWYPEWRGGNYNNKTYQVWQNPKFIPPTELKGQGYIKGGDYLNDKIYRCSGSRETYKFYNANSLTPEQNMQTLQDYPQFRTDKGYAACVQGCINGWCQRLGLNNYWKNTISRNEVVERLSLKPNVNAIDLTVKLQNKARANYNIVFEFLKGNSLVGSFSKNIGDRKKPLEEKINIKHINDFNNVKITIKGNSNGWRGIVKYDWTLRVLSTKENTKAGKFFFKSDLLGENKERNWLTHHRINNTPNRNQSGLTIISSGGPLLGLFQTQT